MRFVWWLPNCSSFGIQHLASADFFFPLPPARAGLGFAAWECRYTNSSGSWHKSRQSQSEIRGRHILHGLSPRSVCSRIGRREGGRCPVLLPVPRSWSHYIVWYWMQILLRCCDDHRHACMNRQGGPTGWTHPCGGEGGISTLHR